MKDDVATICSNCKIKTQSGEPKIPKLSIAAGIDFGHPDRIGLPQLTLSEELLICRSRQYVSILKLLGNMTAERQTAKKGHVITFPQPDGPLKLAELQRMNASFGNSL